MQTDAQSRHTTIEGPVGVIATSGAGRGSHYRIIVVELILKSAISRHIEAGRIGQIKDIEGVTQLGVLSYRSELYQRNIGAALRRLPKDIALSVRDEIRLIEVARWNSSIKIPGTEEWHGKAGSLKSRVVRAERA